MKRFEYKVLKSGMESGQETLNDLGKEGWELVCVQQIGVGLNYFFRRELNNGKRK